MDLSILARHIGENSARMPRAEVQELPVFALSNAVLVPGIVLPLQIFEASQQQLIDAAGRTHADVVVCFSPLGKDRQAMMSSVCGAGLLTVLDEFSDGSKYVTVEGDYRVEILSFTQQEPFLVAKVRWVRDRFGNEAADLIALQEHQTAFLKLVKQWLFLMDHVPMEYAAMFDSFKYSHHLADFIAGYFFPDYTLRQKLLETVSPGERVQMVEAVLRKGVEWLASQSLPAVPLRQRQYLN